MLALLQFNLVKMESALYTERIARNTERTGTRTEALDES